MCFMGCGTIDANDTAATFATDSIGGKALAVGNVVYLHLLVFNDAAGFQQRFVNGDAAVLVLQ